MERIQIYTQGGVLIQNNCQKILPDRASCIALCLKEKCVHVDVYLLPCSYQQKMENL